MSAAPRKKTLILCRRAPYGNPLARAGLDLVLAAAAFEHGANVLFMDDGVWQLVPGQEAKAIGQKNLRAVLQSLPLYGIDTLYADGDSLAARHIALDELSIGEPTLHIEALGPPALAPFIEGHGHIISF